MMGKTAERIKKHRLENKITQKSLAAEFGIDPKTVSRWECGDRNPGREKLVRMARMFHVTTDYLLGEVDDPKLFVPHDDGYEMNEEGEYVQTEKAIIKQAIQNMKDFLEVITIPILSIEQMAHCKNGLPCLDITSHLGGAISITKQDVGDLVDDLKPPFAIETQGMSMNGWGIYDGSRVIINPAEKIRNMDIALVCYHDKLALKKIKYRDDMSIDLLSSDGSVIHVDKKENTPEFFKIWGKVISQISRVPHGI